MSQLIEFVTNHWMLVLAFVGILALLLGTEVLRLLRNIKDVGPMEAIRLLNQQNALFIDTRSLKEYQDGHVLDALHIPVQDLSGRIGELEKHKNRPIIAYCHSGQRSASAGGVLKKHGFENVYNLGGGMVAWKNANLPVTRK